MLYKFVVNQQSGTSKPLPYGELVDKVRNGNIDEITIKQTEVVSIEKGNNKQEWHTPVDGDKIKGDLMALAVEKDGNGQPHVASKKVNVEPATGGLFWSILVWWGPILWLVGRWILMAGQMQSGGSNALRLAAARARPENNHHKRVTLKHVPRGQHGRQHGHDILEF